MMITVRSTPIFLFFLKINDTIIRILFPVNALSPDVEVENISPSSSPQSPSSTVALANDPKPSSSNKNTEETRAMSSVSSSDRSIYRTGSFYSMMSSPFSIHSLLSNPFSTNRYNGHNIFSYGLSHMPHAYTQSYHPPILIAWTPRTFIYSPLRPLTYGGRVTSSSPPFFQVSFNHLPDPRENPLTERAPVFRTPSTVYNNQNRCPNSSCQFMLPIHRQQLDFGLSTSNLFGFVEVEPVAYRPEHSLPTTEAHEYEPGEVIRTLRNPFTFRVHTSSAESNSADYSAQRCVPRDDPRSTSTSDRHVITSSTRETEEPVESSASSSFSSVDVEPPSSPQPAPLTDEAETPTRPMCPRAPPEPTNFLQKYVLPALTNAISINRDLILLNGRPTEPDAFPVPIIIRSYASPTHPTSHPSLTFSRGNNRNSDIQITIYEATSTVTRLSLQYINVMFATGWVTFLIATTQNNADSGDFSQVWCFPIL